MSKVVAIIIVLLILNIILFFLLKSVIKQINKIVKVNVAESLSVYDRIVQKKEKRIEELSAYLQNFVEDDKTDSKNTRTHQQRDIELEYILAKNKFTDIEFFKNYDYVKRMFKFDYIKILNTFVKTAIAKDHDNPYEILKNALTPQVQYDLLNFEDKEQFNILKQCIPSQYDNILDNYKNQNKVFDIIKFCEFLELKAKAYDNSIIVKMGYPDERIKDISPNIKIEEDKTIIEGMKIVYRNTLYDYSI